MNMGTRLMGGVVLALVLAGSALWAVQEAEEHRLLAEKFVQAGRFADAEREYRLARDVADAAERPMLQNRVAYCLQRQYKMQPAIEEYRKFLEMEGVDGKLRGATQYNIGVCLQLDRKYEEAVAVYVAVEDVEGVAPDTLAQARVSLGHTYGKLGKDEEAIKAYLSAVEVQGANKVTHQTALVTAGSRHQDAERYDQAVECYKRAALEGGSYGHIAANRLIECESALRGSREFFIEPYVSDVGDTTATLRWVSRKGVPGGTVRTVSPAGNVEVKAEIRKIRDRDVFLQTAVLQGLKPYTRYEYEAVCDGNKANGSFRTTRREPGPVRFIAYGDTQGGWQYHEKLAALMAAENPDFVVHVGDCVERGDRWDEWKGQMFDPARAYMKQCPIYVSWGNHDGSPYFADLFGYLERPYKRVVSGDVEVYVLDSNFHFGRTTSQQQLEWFEESLSVSEARWKIAAFHHPMYHTVPGDRLAGVDNFRPIIETQGVDFVLNGHYHIYSRLLPIGLPDRKPVISIITGGGGGGQGGAPCLSPITVNNMYVKHYTMFDIDGENLVVTAKDIEGNVIDRLELVKKDGMFQPEVMAATVDSDLSQVIRMTYNDLKHQHYNRVDLTASYSGSGDKGTVLIDRNILDVAALPADTELVVERSSDCDWDLPTQTLKLAAGELGFSASPPGGKADAETIKDHPLVIVATLKVGGRLFEPQRFPVTLAFGE